MEPLIKIPRSVVPAADVSLDNYPGFLTAISGVPGIGSVKLGFSIGLTLGLPMAVEMAKSTLGQDCIVIYDHQKAGTDIPDTGKVFANVMAEAKVDAAIIFPQAGPVTQEEWTKELQEKGIRVIVGGEMTHKGYLAKDGGYIRDEAPFLIYQRAMKLGVVDFVVPGNKAEAVQNYRQSFDEELGSGNYALYAPGFITQGGDISDIGKVAGERWHAIVGRAIAEAGSVEAMKEASRRVTSQIA